MNGSTHTVDIAPMTSVTFLEWDGNIEAYAETTTGDTLLETFPKAAFMAHDTGFLWAVDFHDGQGHRPVLVTPADVREAQATLNA